MSVLDAFSLSGKVSVVTGANRGIGRALATALAEAGSDVVLLVRDTGAAVEAIKEFGVSRSRRDRGGRGCHRAGPGRTRSG
jgi:NAD(P)-dependent dehydrogenase (short-subunit alcohol dehydrogenase family)